MMIVEKKRLNCMLKFMSKHYYFSSILVVVFAVIAIYITGCAASRNIRNAQTIDSTLIKHEQAYRDSIRHNPSLQALAGDQLDSLCNKWDSIFVQHQQSLNKSQEAMNLNLTLWMSVIASICTILPIVLGMNQNNSQKFQLEQFNRDFEKEKKTLQTKIKNTVDEFNTNKEKISNEIEQYSSKLCHTEVISLLNLLSQNLNLLCNLQEIENKENPILTNPGLVKSVVASFKMNVEKCNSRFKNSKTGLNEDSILSIQNALMSTLCSIRDMAYLYENIFNGRQLLILQRLRDDLSFFIYDKTSLFQKPLIKDVEACFEKINSAAKVLDELFKEFEN